MALADEIQALRDHVLDNLSAAHDYYADTTTAWQLVQKVIEKGDTFSVRNTTTGTVTTQTDLVARAPGYISVQLTEATFQQFISILENYLFDLLRFWLTAYPRSLSGKKVDFKEILDAPDKEAIAQIVVTRELNDVLYDRPAGWFAYLEDKVKLGCPSADEIERISEAKASRDVLVHTSGIAGKTYTAKAGKLARFKEGDRIEISEQYHREIWELIRKVVADTSNAAMAKSLP